MVFDRIDRDPELSCDGLVTEAGSHELQQCALARRERRTRGKGRWWCAAARRRPRGRRAGWRRAGYHSQTVVDRLECVPQRSACNRPGQERRGSMVKGGMPGIEPFIGEKQRGRYRVAASVREELRGLRPAHPCEQQRLRQLRKRTIERS